eukprot:CAMPEP_0178986228 /NCGR_PEP_ID=MMETSP0795-20121207/2594_1 /TAXON_ID=88552 /ORGANISM="Amoebophrya sp., Strain Ameob2" /LENGTH=408 /DNA_ID=CAMNT_0020677279 /DNA_START=78 /DNA_END=1304 /DNA_ORIENTATION=-
MCGRCAAIVEKACVEKIAGTSRWRRNKDKVSGKYNLSPYDKTVCVPVIHSVVPVDPVAESENEPAEAVETATAAANRASGHRTTAAAAISGMRMVPRFAKEEQQKFTFNSRLDKLEASPMWNRCLKRENRCIVVLQGFYEWGSAKRPRFVQNDRKFEGFGLSTQERESEQQNMKEANKGKNFPLLVCGIYDRWAGAGLGGFSASAPLESCSIITTGTPAKSALAPIHDRIPLMLLDPELARQWLFDQETPFGDLVNRIERASAAAKLEIFEVNKLVGNSRNESPDCILSNAEYDAKQFQKNFGRFMKPPAVAKKEGQVGAGGGAAKKEEGRVRDSTSTSGAVGSARPVISQRKKDGTEHGRQSPAPAATAGGSAVANQGVEVIDLEDEGEGQDDGGEESPKGAKRQKT